MALGPDGRPTGQISQAAQAALGLPPNWQRGTPYPFQGVNQTDDRTSIADSEFYWLENLLKIGAGRLRALGDTGTPLYRADPARNIKCFFWFNIGPIDYVAVFLDNGTAVQVQRTNGAVVVISATPNTFFIPSGGLPACCGSGGQYLLICNNNTNNDYWIWDGAVLFHSGSIGPKVTITDAGSGYTSPPTVTAYGGSGGGIVATADIANGSVVFVHIINPGSGYQPGDVVQFHFSGGGSDEGAQLSANISAGSVSEVIVTDHGTGYSSTPAVGFSGGGGLGAAGFAVMTSGGDQVDHVVITNPGTGYTGNPNVSFIGGSPSTPAAASSQITPGVVTGINVDNGGTGFTGTPLLTIVGGGGSGATAVANVSGGVIVSGTVTAGGSGYTSSPSVEISGGLNRAAQAIAELMPFGVSGTYIETYQSRVWIPHPHQATSQQTGGIFNVSAPGSLTDFATSDGGLEFTSTDRYLRSRYTFLRQANGYLYPVGDSSVSVISNVQTSGNPATTTFTYANSDPQTGSNYQNSVADYGRTILFSNKLGVWGIFGGAVTKVSAKIDRLFQEGVFPGNAANTPCVTPSAAVVSLFDVKLYVNLMTINDPFTRVPRTVMLLWNEKEWFIASSQRSLIFIGGLETESDLFCYGTDGMSIYPMFLQPSVTLPKVMASKLWGADRIEIIKGAMRWYVAGRDLSAAQAGIDLFWVTDYAAALGDGFEGEGSVVSPNGGTALGGNNTGLSVTGGLTDDVVAPLLGFKVTTMADDFEIVNAVLGYIPVASIFGGG